MIASRYTYRQRLRKRLPVYLRHQSDEWETPPDLFRELDQEFGFAVDLAALPHNTKCPRFYIADFINIRYSEMMLNGCIADESLFHRPTSKNH